MLAKTRCPTPPVRRSQGTFQVPDCGSWSVGRQRSVSCRRYGKHLLTRLGQHLPLMVLSPPSHQLDLKKNNRNFSCVSSFFQVVSGLVQTSCHGHHPGSPAASVRVAQRFHGRPGGRDAGAVRAALSGLAIRGLLTDGRWNGAVLGVEPKKVEILDEHWNYYWRIF